MVVVQDCFAARADEISRKTILYNKNTHRHNKNKNKNNKNKHRNKHSNSVWLTPPTDEGESDATSTYLGSDLLDKSIIEISPPNNKRKNGVGAKVKKEDDMLQATKNGVSKKGKRKERESDHCDDDDTIVDFSVQSGR